MCRRHVFFRLRHVLEMCCLNIHQAPRKAIRVNKGILHLYLRLFCLSPTVSHCCFERLQPLLFDVCLWRLMDACGGLLSVLSQSQMNKWIDNLWHGEKGPAREKLPICRADAVVHRDKRSKGALLPEFRTTAGCCTDSNKYIIDSSNVEFIN